MPQQSDEMISEVQDATDERMRTVVVALVDVVDVDVSVSLDEVLVRWRVVVLAVVVSSSLVDEDVLVSSSVEEVEVWLVVVASVDVSEVVSSVSLVVVGRSDVVVAVGSIIRCCLRSAPRKTHRWTSPAASSPASARSARWWSRPR